MTHNKQIIKIQVNNKCRGTAYLITRTFKHKLTSFKLREVGLILINQVDSKH